jgi:2-deoxy-D-gluconate 3-dehydrogenase
MGEYKPTENMPSPSASCPPSTRLSVSELFSIRDKTVIATGITGGIGLEIAQTLAEAGAHIVAIHLSNDPNIDVLTKAIRDLNRQCHSFQCDVSESPALRRIFQQIWDSGITPDILLNCAGWNKRAPIEEIEDEWFDKILAINLKASYVASQEFAKQLRRLENRPGKIINIGSVTSFKGMYNVSPYACSKGGVLQMTKAFSNELASRGIQVNCICPG